MKCVFCRKGTYLNEDGYCEVIHPVRCEFADFRFNRKFKIEDMYTALWLFGEGPGCERCDKGYVGVKQNPDVDKMVCTQSSYHADVGLPEVTHYIKFCKHYHA